MYVIFLSVTISSSSVFTLFNNLILNSSSSRFLLLGTKVALFLLISKPSLLTTVVKFNTFISLSE